MPSISASSYVRNLGKSVGYMAIDSLGSNVDAIKSYIEKLDDGCKTIYKTFARKRESETKKSLTSIVKNSDLYKNTNQLFKNAFSDLKTGNIYNKERKDEVDSASFGGGLDFDFSFDDNDFSFSDSSSSSSNSNSESSSSDNNDDFNTSTIKSIINTGYQQSMATTAAGEFIAKHNKVNTGLIMNQMNSNNTRVLSGIGTVYNEIKATNKFLNTNILAHLENTKRYQDTTIEMLRKMSTSIDEMADIQKSIYRPKNSKYSSYSDDDISSIMDYNGIMDPKEYFKLIKKNIQKMKSDNMVGSMLGMAGSLTGATKPADFIKMVSGSPISGLLGLILSSKLDNSAFGKSLKDFNSTIASFFPSMLSKFDRNSDNKLFSFISKILGYTPDSKARINTANYEKGPVPFDGITRKTINEVIPGYLARIESALTGRGERYFDSERGKWLYASSIERRYHKEERDYIANANYDIKRDAEKLFGDENMVFSTSQKRSLEKKIDNIINTIYKDNGRFESSIDKGWKYYGFSSPEEFRLVKNSLSRDTIRNIAASNMSARSDVNRRFKDIANEPGLYSILFNNTFGSEDEDDITTGAIKNIEKRAKKDEKYFECMKKLGVLNSKGEYIPSNDYKSPEIMKSSNNSIGFLNANRDSYGKNVFDYLRDIFNVISNNRKGGRKGRRGYKPVNPTPSGGSSSGSSSNSSESSDSDGGDSDPDSDGDLDWETIKQYRDSENDTTSNPENSFYDTRVGRFIKEKFGNKFDNVAKVVGAPLNAATKFINKANNTIYKFLFGDKEYYNDKGEKLDSVFDYMAFRMEKSFNEVTNKILDTLKNKVKPIIDKYIKPVMDNVKDILSRGWKGVKNTASNVWSDIKSKFSRQADNMEDGGVSSADDFEADSGIKTSAYGRIATKRGLTMISPGEIIIPATFDKNKQRKMEKAEKRDRNRIANAIALNAKGNIKGSAEEKLNQLKGFFSNILGDSYDHTSKVLAGGIVGGGAGLLVGNPLLGAVAGAGLSIINSSETAKKFLLGDMITNEDGTKGRSGGIIPKRIIDVYTKAAPDMSKFSLVGGVAGLLTGFGPLGGAAVGAGISLLKNNETVQNILFGENGLFEKEGVEKFKKFAKKAAPHALIGAGIGALAGPFGILGNSIIGSGLGLLTATDTFHKVMFGDPDNPEKNSVMKALNKTILIPSKEKILSMLDEFKEYAKENMLKPLKNFWNPFKQGIKNVIHDIGYSIADSINNAFSKFIGLPAMDFFQEKIFKPLGKAIGAVAKSPINLAKGIISAPFKMLGSIGNRMRMRQIEKGKAYDMSAAERLAFRQQYSDNKLFNRFIYGNKKKGTNGLVGLLRYFNEDSGLANTLEKNRYSESGSLLNTILGRDNAFEQDNVLAGLDDNALNMLLSNTSAMLNSDSDIGNQMKSIRSGMQNRLSDLFNKRDVSGKTLYDKLGYKTLSKFTKQALSGEYNNIDELSEYIDSNLNLNGFAEEDRNSIKNSILNTLRNGLSDSENDVNTLYRLGLTLGGSRREQKEIEDKLSQALGRKISGRSGIRSVREAIQAELKARGKNVESTTSTEEPKTPEEKTQQTVENISSKIDNFNNSMLNAIKEVIYTMNPKARPKSESTTNNASETAKNVADDGSKVINTIQKANEKSLNDRSDEDKEKFYDQDTGNVVSSDTSSREYKENKEQHAEIKEKKDKENKENSQNFNDLIDSLIGKRKERKKSRSGIAGILGRIVGFKEKVSSPLGTVAKIGKKIVGGALLVSLFGYASEFVKTSIWPKIQTFLFGKQNEDGARSGGLLGGLKNIFVGKDGKSGILGSVFNWFGEKFNAVKNWYLNNGGLSGLLAGALEKIIIGHGYAIQNLVAPAVSLIIQSLPGILWGTVKGIVKGLTAVITKRKPANDNVTFTDYDTNVTKYLNAANKNNSNLKSALTQSTSTEPGVKKTSNNYSNVIKAFDSSKSTNYKTTSTFNITGGNTSSSNAKMKSVIDDIDVSGIENPVFNITTGKAMEASDFSGNTNRRNIIGGTSSTNQIVTDENGNILNDYTQYHDQDGILSKGIKTGTRFGLQVLAGINKGTTVKAAKIVGKTGKLIFDHTKTGKAANFIGKAIGNAKIVKSATTKIGTGINNLTSSAVKKIAEKTGVEASKNSIGGLFKSLFENMAKSPIGSKLLIGVTKGAGTKTLQNALLKAGEKLSKYALTKIAGKSLVKLASVLSNATPLGIALGVVDFLWGMTNAETIMGVAKGGYNISFGIRAICGLTNFLTNRFLLGIIPASVIMDVMIDAVLPAFGMDLTELKDARSNYNQVLNAWNKEHPEETYDNLEDFNKRKKAPWYKRAGNWFGNIFGVKDKEVEAVINKSNGNSRTSSGTSSALGIGSARTTSVGKARGHIYQHDPAIKNMKYGNSTLGESGCAPVAVTNALRHLTGRGDLNHAMSYAEANGMVSKNGTSMNYFNSYLADNGISTSNTNSASDALQAIKQGKQVIMFGKDNSNNGMPFGTTPHFITATGYDRNGNVIVEDPDLPSGSTKYNKSKIANSMKSSVIINGKKNIGKGTESTDSSSAEDTSTTNKLFSQIGNLGTNIMKKMYGGLYDAMYGDGDDTSSSSDSTTNTSSNSSGKISLVSNKKSNTITSMDVKGNSNAEKIWNYLRSKGFSKAGAAGIMGNFRMESAYKPYAVEATELKKLGYTGSNSDTLMRKFTDDLQNGKISKDTFVNTYFGYGLPQFTYNTWKEQLYDATVGQGKRIDSIPNQLDYLTGSWNKYCGGLVNRLKNAKDPGEAAIDVLHSYEMPNWKSVKQYLYDNERKAYAKEAYNAFAVGSGRAQRSIDQNRMYADDNRNIIGSGSANTISNANTSISYDSFLNTIVSILLKISDNTALLNKVLEILSKNFGIDIDESDIDAASRKTKLQTKAALNELVKRNSGNTVNISKLLNNQSNEYIISAMSELARE